MTGRRKKWDVLGLKQNTEVKRNELPLQSRPDILAPGCGPALPARLCHFCQGKPGSHANAVPPPAASATKNSTTPSPGNPGRAPRAGHPRALIPSPSHPSTECARPTFSPPGPPAPAHPPVHGLLPTPSCFTGKGRKCPCAPSTQRPTLLALLSPGSSLWTLHLGTRPSPCRRPRNMAPAGVPSPLCVVSHPYRIISHQNYRSAAVSPLSQDLLRPQPPAALHAPSLPGFPCTTRWEPLLSRSSMTSVLPKPPDKSPSLYLTWRQVHWTELTPFPGFPAAQLTWWPPPPCPLRPRSPGSHPASGLLRVSHPISSPDPHPAPPNTNPTRSRQLKASQT